MQQRNSFRRAYSSDGASILSTSVSGASADHQGALTVFKFAPYWLCASSWHCKHPDTLNETSFIKVTGPHTSEDMHHLYKNRQMKGSNLVIGLASKQLPPGDIPPSFFRTLAYMFELAKAGSVYQPITEADLAELAADPSWCCPLWCIPQDSSNEGGSDHSSGDLEDLSSQMQAKASLHTDVAERLFLSAPYWCYLYSHDVSRAKKTPPKTSEQMLAMLHQGYLPEWTPLVGLKEEVATFNSLPPCLFMTLSSLLHFQKSGNTYKPVGVKELSTWDKFIDSRAADGSTQGIQQMTSGPVQQLQNQHSGLSSHAPSPQKPPISTPPPMPAPAPAFGMPYFSPGYLQYPGQQAHALYQQGYPPQAMQWYGSYAPSVGMYSPQQISGFGASQMQSNPDIGFSEIDGPERSSAPSAQGARMPTREFRTQLSSPGQYPGVHRQNAKRQSSMPMPRLKEYAPMESVKAQGERWETPIFRLFTADATRGADNAAWWYMAQPAPAGSIPVGPLSAEKMILAYARGQLTDNHHACGIPANTPSDVCPPYSMFERIGQLLEQVEQGGEYKLLSHDEVMGGGQAYSSGANQSSTESDYRSSGFHRRHAKQ